MNTANITGALRLPEVCIGKVVPLTVILAPNVAQFKIAGTVGPNPWNCICHFTVNNGAGSMSNSQLSAMATALFTGLTSEFGIYWPSAVQLDSILGVDLGVNAPAVGQSTQGAFTSSGSGTQDAASCVMFNFQTAQRYRGGHGRIYFPGLAPNHQTTPTLWDSTTVDNCVNGWVSGVANAVTAATTHGAVSANLCIPQYSYEYTDDPARHRYTVKKVAFLGAAPVTNTLGSFQIRTQRRRLGAA